MYATVNTTEPLPLPGGGSPLARQRYSPPAGPSASSSNGQPSLTAPLPPVASLQAALPAVQNPNADPQSKVAWCRDVLQLVNRVTVASNPSPNASASAASGTGTDLPTGPAHIADPALARLADIAVPLIIQLSSSPSTSGTKLPPYAFKPLYLRASLSASGAFPAHLPVAFRESELVNHASSRPSRLRTRRAGAAQDRPVYMACWTTRVHLIHPRGRPGPPQRHNATTLAHDVIQIRCSKYYPPASEPSRRIWR